MTPMLRWLMIPLVVLSSMNIHAAEGDSTYFVRFTKQELELNDVRSLADVFRLLPFTNAIRIDHTTTLMGGTDIQNIAIYRDGLPLLMDQNTGYDLRSIPLWDIAYIEVRLTDVSVVGKNNSSMDIQIFSETYGQEPQALHISSALNSDLDQVTYASYSASNVKHNIKLGAGRSFRQALELPDQRGDITGAHLRNDVSLQYTYNILSSIQLKLSSNHSFLNALDKGTIVPSTTRVEDVETHLYRHRSYGSITTALSKSHRLKLSGLFHQVQQNRALVDRDLHTGEWQRGRNSGALDSLYYNQGVMDINLSGDFSKYSYTVGIDISTTKDRFYPNIKAIKSEYSDYSVYGLVSYRYKTTVQVNAGGRLITNNLTGSYFIPQGQLTLVPNDMMSIKVTGKSSISYPMFEQVFYPVEFTQEGKNDLTLEPIRSNTLNLGFELKQDQFVFNSGLLFLRTNNIPQLSKSGIWKNDRSSSTTLGYFGLDYSYSQGLLRPSFILHSNNALRNTLDQYYFYPEFNIYARHRFTGPEIQASATLRLIGSYSDVYQNEDIILLDEYGTRLLANLALTRYWNDERWGLHVGVTDVFDQNITDRTTYELVGFDRLLVENDNVYNGMGRRIFAQIDVKL